MEVVATPRRVLSFEYLLVIGGDARGSVIHRAFGRAGSIRVDGVDHVVHRNGPFQWTAEQVGIPGEVAAATRVGRLRSRVRVTWPAGTLEVRRAGLGARHDLTDADAVVGHLRHRSLLTRSLLISVPDGTPLTAVGMLVWLSVRARRAAMTHS